MASEEPIPQDEGQQGDNTSSNTYPGQDKNFNNRVGLNDIKRLANGGKKLAKTGRIGQTAQKARAAAQATSATARVVAQAAARAAAQAAAQFAAATAASATGISVGWLIIIVVIIVVIIIVVLNKVDVLGASIYSNQPLTSSGPVFAKIGDKLDYTITLDYPGTAQNIIVTDKIPAGTEFLNAPLATYSPATNTVTWNVPASSASAALSLTLLAIKDNNYIVNLIKGTMQNRVLGANDSLPAEAPLMSVDVDHNMRQAKAGQLPTVFQLAPTSIPVSPQDTNVIKSCVVTKVGEPVIIPSLPPECTDF